MSTARLVLLAGIILVVCVLEYLRQVARRKRELTVYGALFGIGVAIVGVLLVNAGVQGLGVLRT